MIAKSKLNFGHLLQKENFLHEMIEFQTIMTERMTTKNAGDASGANAEN